MIYSLRKYNDLKSERKNIRMEASNSVCHAAKQREITINMK